MKRELKKHITKEKKEEEVEMEDIFVLIFGKNGVLEIGMRLKSIVKKEKIKEGTKWHPQIIVIEGFIF